MNLKELRDLGGLVPAEPVEKEVTWTRMVEGKEKSDTFTVWVKRHSFGTLEKMYLVENDDRSRSARYLAESLLLGDKKEALTYKDAYMLEPSLATALLHAINEVNGLGAEPKN